MIKIWKSIYYLIIHIYSHFSDKKSLYKYIKDLESIVRKQKIREANYNKEIVELKNNYSKNEQINKELKEELFSLQRVIRNLPPEKQIYLQR